MGATAEDTVRSAIKFARSALVEPGDWLTGSQRRAAWIECRDARSNELDRARKAAHSPNAVDGAHGATEDLSAEAVEVLHRVTSDPGRLTRAWADKVMETLGDAAYTELVGIAAIAASIDMFDTANVSRTLSLVPVTNHAWRKIVDGLYSRGAEFTNLTRERALTRPQVELVAARTTAELECFY
jgi:hypothetical protein